MQGPSSSSSSSSSPPPGPDVAAVIFGHEMIPNGNQNGSPSAGNNKADSTKKLVSVMAKDLRSQRIVLAVVYGIALQMIFYISLHTMFAYSATEDESEIRNKDVDETEGGESSYGILRFGMYLVKTVVGSLLRTFVGPFFSVNFLGIAAASCLCSTIIGYRMQAQECRCESLRDYFYSWLSTRLWLEVFTFGSCASFMTNCYVYAFNWSTKNVTFLSKVLDENKNESNEVQLFLNDNCLFLYIVVFINGIYVYSEWCRGSKGGFTLAFPTVPLKQAEVIRNNIIELFPKVIAETISLVPFVYVGLYGVYRIVGKPLIRLLGYNIDSNNELGMFSAGMWIQAGFFCFLISYLFQLLYIVVEAMLTEELELSLANFITSNKHQYLLTDAMNSKDSYMQHLGFHTFKMSANPFRPGVNQFYELSHPGSHPRNWTSICTATLKACDNLYKELRDFIKPKSFSAKPESYKKPPSAYLLTSDNPENKNRLEPRSPNLRFLAATALPNQRIEENSASYIREGFMSPVILVTTFTSKVKAAIMKKFEWVTKLRQTWQNPKAEITVANVVSGFQLVLWGVNGLVEIICMSIELDKHGVIQRDMSKVIHKFVDLYKICLEVLADSRLSSESVTKLELISQAIFYAIAKIHVSFGKHYEMLRVGKEYQIFVADIVKMDTQLTNE